MLPSFYGGTEKISNLPKDTQLVFPMQKYQSPNPRSRATACPLAMPVCCGMDLVWPRPSMDAFAPGKGWAQRGQSWLQRISEASTPRVPCPSACGDLLPLTSEPGPHLTGTSILGDSVVLLIMLVEIRDFSIKSLKAPFSKDAYHCINE